jgi:ABC-type taurine transport system substrate-binding protein
MRKIGDRKYIFAAILTTMYMMRERGFDKRQGLEFDEKPAFAGGASVIAAIVSGDLDVGVVGSMPAIGAAESRLMPDKLVIAESPRSRERAELILVSRTNERESY